MREYLVVSPPFEKVEPVLDYGEGPTYVTRLTLKVRARKKHRAIQLAVRVWQKRYSWGMPYCASPRENPLKGVKAYPWGEDPA